MEVHDVSQQHGGKNHAAATYSSKESSMLYAEYAKAQYNDGIEFLNEHVQDLVSSFKGSSAEDTFYILDFGCGSCPFFERFVILPFAKIKVVGVDPDKNRIDLAREKFSEHVQSGSLELVHADDETFFDALPKNAAGQPCRFNLVLSNYVLMWVENKTQCLSRLIDSLADNGLLLLQAVESMDPYSIIPSLMKMMKPKEGVATQSDIDEMIHRTFGCMRFRTFEEELEHLAKFRKAQDYQVLKAEHSQFLHTFDSLDDLFTWWRGTSHGNFDASLIPPDPDLKQLREKYPSKINVAYPRYRLVICKTRKSVAS